MDWGSAFKAAYDAASDAARSAADTAMSSARDAAAAVARAAQAAADKAASAARGVANMAGFAGRTVADTPGKVVGLAGFAVTEPYRQAAKAMAPKSSPQAVQPCPECWDAKKARLEQRNQAIAQGRASPDPAVNAAAARLAQNNDAVELAKLALYSYDQYPNGGDFSYPDGKVPAPSGWSVVPASKLPEGVSVEALERSRAVVYQTPEDWPGGQKTVLAFRGTADAEDAMVDYDQAMSQPSAQYTAAMKAGREVAKGYGTDTLVTGHSLGGGKAQAAGALTGMGGTMFNSAGLNPATVDGMMPSADQFQQYRNSADPLTGIQNSPLIQTAIAGVAGGVLMPLGALLSGGNALSSVLGGPTLPASVADYADKAMKAFPRGMSNLFKDGNVMPPAIGPVHEVPAIAPDGSAVSAGNLMGQHSMVSVVNGIEKQKDDDVAAIHA
ncbi:MAG: hypothetical protein ABJD97_13845 [Betaproteobacteria bacterium]